MLFLDARIVEDAFVPISVVLVAPILRPHPCSWNAAGDDGEGCDARDVALTDPSFVHFH